MTKNKKLGFVATAFIASSFVLAGGVTALNYNKTNAETVGGTITVSDDFTQAGSMSDLNAYAYSHVAKSPDGHSFGLMPIDKWAQMANPESGWITYKVKADEGYTLQDTVVSYKGAISGRSCGKTWEQADIRVCVSPNGQDWKYVYSQREDNINPETGKVYGPEGNWNNAYKWYDLSVELPDVYDGLEEIYVRYELRQASYTALNANALTSTYTVKGEDGQPLLDENGKEVKANYTSLEHYWGTTRADDETRTVLVAWENDLFHSQIGSSMQNVSITANQAVKSAEETDTISVSNRFNKSYGAQFTTIWNSDVYEYAGMAHNADCSTGIMPIKTWTGSDQTSKYGYITYKMEADEGKALTSLDYSYLFAHANGANGTQWSTLRFDIAYSYDNVNWTNVWGKKGNAYEGFTNKQIDVTESGTIGLDGAHSVVYIRFMITNYEYKISMSYASYIKAVDLTATQIDAPETVAQPEDYVKSVDFGTTAMSSCGFYDYENVVTAKNKDFALASAKTWDGNIANASGHFTYAIPLKENGKVLANLSFGLEYFLRDVAGDEDITVCVNYDNGTDWTLVQSMRARNYFSVYTTNHRLNALNYTMDLTEYVANAESDTLYVRVNSLYPTDRGTTSLQNSSINFFSVNFAGDYAVLSNGASVRLSGQNGIRFETIVNDSFVSAKESAGYTLTYGTFIMPVDYLTSKGALTEANLFGDNAIFCWGKAEAGKTQILHRTANLVKTAYTPDGYSTFYYSILNVKEENLNRGFVALGYIKLEKDGEVEYIFADGGNDVASTARSATYVAQKAIESGDLTGDQPHALWEAYISKCDTATTRTASVKLKNVYVLKTIAEDGTETIAVTSNYGETQTGNIGQLYSKEHSDVTYSGVAYTAVDCIEIDGELCWSQQSCFVKADGTSELVRYNYAVVDNSAKVA